MTTMTVACPETGQALTPMMFDESMAQARLALHCPKCSQLHAFACADAAAEDPVRTPVLA